MHHGFLHEATGCSCLSGSHQTSGPQDFQTPVTSTGVEAIRRKDIAGYVTQQSLLDYTVSLQPCDMAIVDKGFGYGSQVKQKSQ